MGRGARIFKIVSTSWVSLVADLVGDLPSELEVFDSENTRIKSNALGPFKLAYMEMLSCRGRQSERFSWKGEKPMISQLRVLHFGGFHSDTLGHYFSALGLLAAISQRWPEVRGCWRHGRFLLLHESLTEEQVKEYLLDDWQPTPYERWWGDAQKADTKGKGGIRSVAATEQCSIQQVQILECHLVGVNRNQFNPVFGAGGTLGQRDFAEVCVLRMSRRRRLPQRSLQRRA